MYQTFIDLDELMVLCRDKSAKKFIQEAVACYRAGAFRSCIVATWNAVVFDFLHKLRQLEQLGDGEASKQLQNFEKMRAESAFKKLWDFESSIPDLAEKKFEFISSVEKPDITRLFEDRSRCAHPSMTSLEDPFEATAELARCHLRSAVMHLLQYPPVQGRAASQRIFQDIKSEYFPTEPELAVKYFQKGPLARARLTLIKDIVNGLTVSLLTEDLPTDERERQFSALNAVYKMYPQETGQILNDRLSNIILDKVTDENWDNVIFYLIKCEGWESLSEPCRLKAKTFIDKLDISRSSNRKRLSEHNVYLLLDATQVDFLRDDVFNKLKDIPVDKLFEIKEDCQEVLQDDNRTKVVDLILQEHLPNIVPNIVDDFINSYSFDNSKYNASQLSKIADYLNPEQWSAVMSAFCDNNQIYNSWGCSGIIIPMFKNNIKLASSIQPYWLSFREKLNDEKFNHDEDIDSLKQMIDSYLSTHRQP